MIVIARLPAHIDHAVDRGGAAQHAPARIVQRPAVQARHRLGLEAPIGARIAHAVEIADRHMDPEIIVAAAGFEQQHPVARIGAEAVGQHAAGRSRADDDIVEFPNAFHVFMLILLLSLHAA